VIFEARRGYISVDAALNEILVGELWLWVLIARSRMTAMLSHYSLHCRLKQEWRSIFRVGKGKSTFHTFIGIGTGTSTFFELPKWRIGLFQNVDQSQNSEFRHSVCIIPTIHIPYFWFDGLSVLMDWHLNVKTKKCNKSWPCNCNSDWMIPILSYS
jgi:hypothetical protein